MRKFASIVTRAALQSFPLDIISHLSLSPRQTAWYRCDREEIASRRAMRRARGTIRSDTIGCLVVDPFVSLIVINRDDLEGTTLTRHPQSDYRRARPDRRHLFKLILVCRARIRQLVFATPRGA